ncbi:hypothetical protein [Pseudomonas sp. B21-048]|uniref:hypothetical protein n=1 Tax=Pseudomonas sp. B21-048 TaxID=2895490 RepID=UPI00215E3FF2|nr:hypothetical protein [Pseudomonas sp. B21-048]UVL01118.1 hypothetical protein LOY56_12585 [Pseudomonas sp. B21-048]
MALNTREGVGDTLLTSLREKFDRSAGIDTVKADREYVTRSFSILGIDREWDIRLLKGLLKEHAQGTNVMMVLVSVFLVMYESSI